MTDPRTVAESAAADLQERLGPRLRSVVLYGSAARDEFVPTCSDINLFVLFDRIDAPLLQTLSPAAVTWPDLRINAMLLDDHAWRGAADAFAVELLDMKDARVQLQGADPVPDVAVHLKDARLQAEHELRSRMIALHNGMALFADSPARLGTLLRAALPSFATYMRTALRLADRPVPRSTREVLVSICRLIDAPNSGILQAWDARTMIGDWTITLEDDVVTQYNAAVEKTASFVDSLGRNAE
jgi:hypothetical protein